MEVQSQVPINKDKIVLLYFRHMSEGFVKKLYKTVDTVKYRHMSEGFVKKL